MKTLTLKNALVLSALTLAPALALTSSAQAAPDHRAYDRDNTSSTWNNSRDNAPRAQAQTPRFEGRSVYNQPRPDNQSVYNQPHFDNRYTPAPRSVPSYSGPRYDSRRDYNRGRDYRNDNGNSTTGAIIGAIIGAVLSR